MGYADPFAAEGGEERAFFEQVVISAPPDWEGASAVGECWLWQGELDDDGRGIVPYRLVHRGHGPGAGEPLADRWLWARRRGALPPGFALARLCHNVACVRPSHGLLRRWNPPHGPDT